MTKSLTSFRACGPIVFVLIWAEVGQGDLHWKRETAFLSGFLAAKPNIFSTFEDALSIEETGFFYQKCCKKESADLTNVNFNEGNYGG